MARLIEREGGVLKPEEGEEIVDLNTEDNNELVPEPATPEPAPEPVEDVPDKYKGKSLKEVIEMHQEAEKLHGRQGGEVGELRKQVDALIQAQLTSQAAAPANTAEPEEEIDFFADPDKAVERAIANHPQVKAAGEAAVALRNDAAMASLERKHPDMGELMASEDFGTWVTASPVRTRLMQQAHHQYDVEAADELFSLYKERQQVVQQTLNVEQQERKQQVKAASTGETRGQGARSSRRIYRRADIINLMQTDPDRYARMSDEIMQAYAEGRVKT